MSRWKMYRGCAMNYPCLLTWAEKALVSTPHSEEQRIQVGEEGLTVVEEVMQMGVVEEGVGEGERRLGVAEGEEEEAGAVGEAEGEEEAYSRDWTHFDRVDYSY